jgi:hypothetical protein
MRVVSKICQHTSGSVRMKQIYERTEKNGKWTFVQCGWLCPDCFQLKKDDLTH